MLNSEGPVRLEIQQIKESLRSKIVTLDELATSEDDWRTLQLSVIGVSLEISNIDWAFRTIIEGQLPDKVVLKVAEELQEKLGDAIHEECNLEFV